MSKRIKRPYEPQFLKIPKARRARIVRKYQLVAVISEELGKAKSSVSLVISGRTTSAAIARVVDRRFRELGLLESGTGHDSSVQAVRS